ncbi:MAG: thiamine pyrophosphate-dependent enzyme [Mobiluncus sp.]|uniref:thiamine pyrophosphate-binding protein n=1 Tax=Mobiluncus sp. TaxID=47293 RepID=UPI002589D453|nr:thiamine pyrophosphate-binding protein [Mobiluncus sp.]MCI6585179.1 thiamine pyrophosphate-dependent enzyme [Mobiluncus sp.]
MCSDNPPLPGSMARARELVEILVSKGVRNWYYAPGSRDAPLGYALAGLAETRAIDLVVRIDERDAAFMALGAARAGKLAAVVMTSGTAVGNVLPAVMEAYHAQLPLLIVSADRPASLRGTGANQTTWQPGMFRNFVGFEADLQPEDGLAALREAALRAVEVSLNGSRENATNLGMALAEFSPNQPDLNRPLRNTPTDPGRSLSSTPLHNAPTNPAVQFASATPPSSPDPLCADAPTIPPHEFPGPVHLNVSFVEPLVPAEVEAAFAAKHPAPAPVSAPVPVPASEPVSAPVPVPVSAPDAVAGPGFTGSVIIVGDNQGGPDWRAGERELWELATSCHLPVLAEPTAGRWRHHPNAVRAASRIVGETALGSGVTSGAVIGRATLTRPIARLLKRLKGMKSLVKMSELAQGSFASQLTENSRKWLENWREEGERLAAELTRDWGIHQAARAIWEAEQDIDLFLGASLTIRAFDAVAGTPGVLPSERGNPADSDRVPDLKRIHEPRLSRRVFTNRGLAGIDGTIASAWGVALASGRAVRAVMGDVTFFHDLGALSYGSLETTPNLQVIVLDNGGGEIFAGLEHGQAAPPVRERMFLTPQRPDPAALAAAAGWVVETVRNLGDLRAALARPVNGLSLLRVVLP